MFGLGVPEILIILVVALLVFGPGRLPEIGTALGRGIRDFKKSLEGSSGDGDTTADAASSADDEEDDEDDEYDDYDEDDEDEDDTRRSK